MKKIIKSVLGYPTKLQRRTRRNIRPWARRLRATMLQEYVFDFSSLSLANLNKHLTALGATCFAVSLAAVGVSGAMLMSGSPKDHLVTTKTTVTRADRQPTASDNIYLPPVDQGSKDQPQKSPKTDEKEPIGTQKESVNRQNQSSQPGTKTPTQHQPGDDSVPPPPPDDSQPTEPTKPGNPLQDSLENLVNQLNCNLSKLLGSSCPVPKD